MPNDTANALGIGVDIECDSEVFTLTPITEMVKGQYQRYLEMQAEASLVRRAKDMSPIEFDKARVRLDERLDTGYYGFHTLAGQRSLQTPDSIISLIHLCFKTKQPKITRAKVETLLEKKPEEIMAAMRVCNPGFFRHDDNEGGEDSGK